jgi:hypothetical protein
MVHSLSVRVWCTLSERGFGLKGDLREGLLILAEES